jgi:cytochrome oxidase assembly protein ShyY1
VTRPRTRRVVLLLVTIVVAGTCVRLGIWQLHRLEWRRAYNASVTAGLATAPSPIQRLLDGVTDPSTLSYRRAVATGTYDASREVILYGRTQNDAPGNHVLTPLVLADGRAIIVDRGWIPFDPEQPTPVQGDAAAPFGTVTVTGVLFPPDSTAPPPAGASVAVTVREIDLTQLQAEMPYRLLPVYLLLGEQTPPQAGGVPSPGSLPELTEGPHLSYAYQWFSFALIAVLGYGLLLRRDRREERGAARRPGVADDASAGTQGGD